MLVMVQSRCFGMLQTFLVQLPTYSPFGRNCYFPLASWASNSSFSLCCPSAVSCQAPWEVVTQRNTKKKNSLLTIMKLFVSLLNFFAVMFPWRRKKPTHQARQSAEFQFQNTASLRLTLYLHSAGPLYTNLLLLVPLPLPGLGV